MFVSAEHKVAQPEPSALAGVSRLVTGRYWAGRAKGNDAQVITMGSRVIGHEAARMVLKAWLGSESQGGNSTRKVTKISAVEDQELAR
jgi:ribose 5-phosphate isomerase RpiB